MTACSSVDARYMPQAHIGDDVVDWLSDMSVGKVDLRLDNMGLAKAALELLDKAAAPPRADDQLSPHFTLSELTASETATTQGIGNTPDADEVHQLSDLATETLEGIRSLCGDHPMLISSGYRSPDLNAAVGGASNSAHLYGCAADFTIPGFGSVSDVCHAIETRLGELQIDQLIDESADGARWVHVGRAIPPATPRHQCLTIRDGATTVGLA